MSTGPASITPFTLHIPEQRVELLRTRLEGALWPEPSDPDDWSSGMPVAVGRALADAWLHDFDWRALERRLNAIPQYTTPIDDHDLHFFHQVSSRPDARPLLLLHGWPGSSTEFAHVIADLAEPADPSAPAFHVVAPTIPGFGISGPVTGWEAQRAAEAFAELLRRLGYEDAIVHGYDLGAIVARRMGMLPSTPVGLLHLTAVFGAEGPTPETIDPADPEETSALAAQMRYTYELGGYALVQSSRPQGVAYLGSDSPIALLAWLVERYHDWSGADPSAGADPERAIGRDEILTTASIFWLCGTLGSSARYYQAGGEEWQAVQPPSTMPTAVCRMPGDISTMVRRFVERTNRIVRWRTLPRGGHFGMWEEPELVVEDLRRTVTDLRAETPGHPSSQHQ